MKSLLSNIGRMWRSLRGIFGSLTSRITKGAGTTVKATGGAVGAGAAVMVLFIVLVIIGIVAVPYGAFAATGNNEPRQGVMANAESFVVEDSRFCHKCGQTDVPTFKSESGRQVCGYCLKTEGGADEETQGVSKETTE